MLKKELRKKYLEKRKGLTSSENEIISNTIINQLNNHFDFNRKLISCFVPISKFNEVNVWPILENENWRCAIPLIEKDELKHVEYKGKSCLKENDWGILEPTNNDFIAEDYFDFVIVPLLTLNEKGNRVGYGKGFYDKFLKKCKNTCTFIGVYQFETIEKIDDINEFDIALHYAVTPNMVHRF